jgi:gamma-glutamylcyclotransferase (GGCT)/AIG2-like uncharacterized protein YtfP
MVHLHRNHFDLAENHCQRALSQARLYEGEEEMKTDLLCRALKVYGSLRVKQDKHDDAVAFAEEAYNCAAIAYNPVHLEVQRAAGILIDCLSRKGDLYNAERFAQATLDSLKDPANKVDQQSEEVARGYFDLANVIDEEDCVKAEMLARESLHIATIISIQDTVLAFYLATKELLERWLAISIKNNGPDGISTAIANANLGRFYHEVSKLQQLAEARKEHLHLSQTSYKEAVRIFTKILGPDNSRTIEFSSVLSSISLKLSET